MKKIILVRHAKSSWTSGESADIDRPLNQRGKRDAPFMAEKLKQIVPVIDGCVKSPSKRTTETAASFIAHFDLSQDAVYDVSHLYHGSLYDILDAIHELPAEWSNVILFAHNPGMTYAAQYFDVGWAENVPTCGMLVIESLTEDWPSLNNRNSKIKTFEYPKKYSI